MDLCPSNPYLQLQVRIGFMPFQSLPPATGTVFSWNRVWFLICCKICKLKCTRISFKNSCPRILDTNLKNYFFIISIWWNNLLLDNKLPSNFNNLIMKNYSGIKLIIIFKSKICLNYFKLTHFMSLHLCYSQFQLFSQ